MSLVNRIRTSNDVSHHLHRLRTGAQHLPIEFHQGQLDRHPPLDAEHDSLYRLISMAWRVLTRRSATILCVAFFVALLGFVHVLMQPRLFTATARLQIDERPSQVVQAGNVKSQNVRDIYDLRTLYQALQSRSLAEHVVDKLKLANDESFLQLLKVSALDRLLSQFEDTDQADRPANKAGRSDRAVRIALANQRVRPVPGSRLVDIAFTDREPERAARVTNVFAQEFIALNQARLSEANTYAKSFLKTQLDQLEAELKASEAKLLDFAKSAKVLTVKDHASVAERQLVNASAALETLVSQRIEKQQQWRQIANSEGGADSFQVPTNAVIDGLRTKRNQLVTEYQGKLSTFKPSYPGMIQIRSKIGETNRQLAIETRSVRNTMKAAYETSLRQEQDMKKHIKDLRSEVMNLQQRSIRYNILKRELATKRKLYDELLRRYKQVDIAAGVISSNVFIVDAARRPSKPSSPNTLRAVFLASGLGLALGFGVAFLQEARDDRISYTEGVEEKSGLCVLGSIPRVKGSATAKALANPHSACSRSYRALAAELIASNNAALKSLFVSSAIAGEGKSTTALALAREFAVMGFKVLLIDADLRKPSLHPKLNCPNTEGLIDILSGTRDPAEVLQATDLPYLAFISSGPLRPGATTLLTDPCLSSLILDAGQVFDAVILDGPAILESAQAQLLANATQSALIVISAGDTKFHQLRNAQKKFHLAQSHIVGVALNNVGKTRTTVVTKRDTAKAHASQRGRHPIAPAPLARSQAIQARSIA